MKSYQIDVPDQIDERIQQRLEACGFLSVGEYIRDLVRRDIHLLEENDLEQAIEEGLNSGFVSFTDEFWAELCNQARANLKSKQLHA